MTDRERLHLPKISGQRCLNAPSYAGPGIYCTRSWGHEGRHVATQGIQRVVVAVWGAS